MANLPDQLTEFGLAPCKPCKPGEHAFMYVALDERGNVMRGTYGRALICPGADAIACENCGERKRDAG